VGGLGRNFAKKSVRNPSPRWKVTQFNSAPRQRGLSLRGPFSQKGKTQPPHTEIRQFPMVGKNKVSSRVPEGKQRRPKTKKKTKKKKRIYKEKEKKVYRIKEKKRRKREKGVRGGKNQQKKQKKTKKYPHEISKGVGIITKEEKKKMDVRKKGKGGRERGW